jgi:hypothetical protein
LVLGVLGVLVVFPAVLVVLAITQSLALQHLLVEVVALEITQD